jgi:lauroyl/myristoyl acyltransferase
LVPAAEHRSVHVIREEEMDPRAQEFLRQLFANQAAASARKTSTVVMHFANDDPMLGPRLVQLLRQGELVALMGDRPRARGRSVTVELFGQPVALPAGPAALARAAGVDVLPVFVFRRGRRRSHAVLRRPIRVSPPGVPGTYLETADIVKLIAEDIEWAIRQEPYQWFCLRQLWSGAV